MVPDDHGLFRGRTFSKRIVKPTLRRRIIVKKKRYSLGTESVQYRPQRHGHGRKVERPHECERVARKHALTTTTMMIGRGRYNRSNDDAIRAQDR